MKEFMSYLRPYRRDGILAAFCIVTETIFVVKCHQRGL